MLAHLVCQTLEESKIVIYLLANYVDDINLAKALELQLVEERRKVDTSAEY